MANWLIIRNFIINMVILTGLSMVIGSLIALLFDEYMKRRKKKK